MDDSAKRQTDHDATIPVARPEPAQPHDVDDAEADDFAARNVLMTNAFGGGASPFAGALIGDKENVIEPTTEEDRRANSSTTQPAPDTGDGAPADTRTT